jgi:hypothetical protein
LNLPEGQKDPNPRDIHYVGNLAFFAMKPHGHGAPDTGGQASFDVTRIVKALKAKNLWKDEQLDVTFVMRGLLPPKGKTAPAPKEGMRAQFATVTLSKQ